MSLFWNVLWRGGEMDQTFHYLTLPKSRPFSLRAPIAVQQASVAMFLFQIMTPEDR